MELISTNSVATAVGSYSQAVKVNGMVFCSGQIPLRADGVLVTGKITEQTRQVLINLDAVLRAAGSSLGKVVKCTVYLKDMNDFALMNKIYEEYFRNHKPARVTVAVSRLPKDVLVEIDCIAVA